MNSFTTYNCAFAKEMPRYLCQQEMNFPPHILAQQDQFSKFSGAQFSQFMGFPDHDTASCTCHGMLNEPVSSSILDAINTDFLEPFDREIELMARELIDPISKFQTSNELFENCKRDPALFNYMKLIDIRGMIVRFIKTKTGSHFVQRQLETCSSMEREMVFQEVFEQLDELIDDEFGNFVVQKLLVPGGDPRFFEMIVEFMLNRIEDLSCAQNACRVVQQAFNTSNEPLRAKMIVELRKSTKELIKDVNAIHVVKKAMDSDAKYVTHVIQHFMTSPGAILEASLHKVSCLVLQKCLQLGNPIQTHLMAAEIFENVEIIANNHYGNFAIQEAMHRASEQDVEMMVDRFATDIFKYSGQKYTSNILEKCLQLGSALNNEKLIRAACGTFQQNLPTVCAMMLHPFGNYVAQRMFENANGAQREMLFSTVRPHVPTIRKYPKGQTTMNKIYRHLKINFMN